MIEGIQPTSRSVSLPSRHLLLCQWLGESGSTSDLGLYIHVPFCRARCHFCAFYLLMHREDRVQRFLRALDQELRVYARDAGLAGRPISSIYLGGGTPTVLSPAQLAAVFNGIHREWSIGPNIEITVEAVPETLTAECLEQLQRAGVTRLSLGGQALNEHDWTRLGRHGAFHEVEQAMHRARAFGFDDINIDVMYGIPGQTLERWMETVSSLVALQPTHVSCYACTIEPHSRFGVDHRRGQLTEPDPALQNVMEDAAERILAEAGYVRYEISNYARPGYLCRHNLRYWTGRDYLGLGPSAQSYIDGIRFGNIADLNAYADCLAKEQLPVESVERLDGEQQERERVIFGLRTIEGVEWESIPRLSQNSQWLEIVDRLIDQGLLRRTRSALRLTADGLRFADSIAVELC